MPGKYHLKPSAGAAGEESLVLDDWVRREDLAVQLGVAVSTLARWHAQRVGPPCSRVGRRVLYRRSGVQKWLRDRELGPVGPRR
jgi:hypothetical protein